MVDGINNSVIVARIPQQRQYRGDPSNPEEYFFNVVDIATDDGLDLLGPETKADLRAKEKTKTPINGEQPNPFYMFD